MSKLQENKQKMAKRIQEIKESNMPESLKEAYIEVIEASHTILEICMCNNINAVFFFDPKVKNGICTASMTVTRSMNEECDYKEPDPFPIFASTYFKADNQTKHKLIGLVVDSLESISEFSNNSTTKH